MDTVHVATLETSNFSFVAVGATEDTARIALARAWAKHRRQTGATLTWADVEDGVTVVALKNGQAARDGSVIR